MATLTAETPPKVTTRVQHAQVPMWVLDKVTNGIAIRVYATLAGKYCDADRFCFPHQATLAEDLGCSLRSIELAVATLREAGALVVVKSRKLNGHWGRNAYILPMADPCNPTAAPVDVDLSDQQEQGIVAGRNHPQSGSGNGPRDFAGREPDPSKQPDPSSESKDKHGADAPSPRSGDGPGDAPQDRDWGSSVSLQAGVKILKPKSGQEEEEQSQDRTPTSQAMTLHDEYFWCDTAKEQRIERLLELVASEVMWLECGIDDTGYLYPMEENAARAMLERGDHWLKVANTIVKQHRCGYARAD